MNFQKTFSNLVQTLPLGGKVMTMHYARWGSLRDPRAFCRIGGVEQADFWTFHRKTVFT